MIATVFAQGSEIILGEARYAVSEDGETAEVAIAVADSWQRNGIAALLVSKLAIDAAAAILCPETRSARIRPDARPPRSSPLAAGPTAIVRVPSERIGIAGHFRRAAPKRNW